MMVFAHFSGGPRCFFVSVVCPAMDFFFCKRAAVRQITVNISRNLTSVTASYLCLQGLKDRFSAVSCLSFNISQSLRTFSLNFACFLVCLQFEIPRTLFRKCHSSKAFSNSSNDSQWIANQDLLPNRSSPMTLVSSDHIIDMARLLPLEFC